jgi:glycosidase
MDGNGDGVGDLSGIIQRLDYLQWLVVAAQARNLKVILDYIPNHSSQRHPWFLQSRATKDSPKRDWYLWRDPAFHLIERAWNARVIATLIEEYESALPRDGWPNWVLGNHDQHGS